MKITFEVDEDAARALAFVIRRIGPGEIERIQGDAHVDERAWERAVQALSPRLPATRMVDE